MVKDDDWFRVTGLIDGDPCMERWRKRLAVATFEASRSIMRGWMLWMLKSGNEFGGLPPSEMVAYQVENRDYCLLDTLQDYVVGVDRRTGYKKRVYGGVRGFFKANRAALPDDDFKIRGTVPKVNGRIEVHQLRNILLRCNPCYRALFLCMFQAGMGAGEAHWWNEHGLQSVMRQLSRNEDYLMIDLPGRKTRKYVSPYHTWIGKDAVEALRAWMKVRPEGDTIFFTKYRTSPATRTMRRYWYTKVKDLGYAIEFNPDHEERGISYRTGMNLHELRDTFRTRWQKSGADPTVGEYLMGHTIDPLEYNKACNDSTYTLREYRKAHRWLNILSDDPEKISIEEYESEMEKVTQENIETRRLIGEQMEEMRREIEVLKSKYK